MQFQERLAYGQELERKLHNYLTRHHYAVNPFW